MRLLRDGATVEAAAAACGVGRRTVYDWRARAVAPPEDAPYVALERQVLLAMGEARGVEPLES